MSRRRRAVVLGGAAIACAALAASLAGSYQADVESQLGELRPVVVARRPLPPRDPLKPGDVRRLLETRRVPAGFAPPDALSDPAEAIGGAPAVAVPAGSYLLASHLRVPGRRVRSGRRPRVGPGLRPVEIAVTGAAALGIGPADPEGSRVDVVVTTEPGPGGGAGRTYVAAEGVPLLDLTAGRGATASDPVPGAAADAWTATLALTRTQALRLIAAESFARSIRLLAR